MAVTKLVLKRVWKVMTDSIRPLLSAHDTVAQIVAACVDLSILGFVAVPGNWLLTLSRPQRIGAGAVLLALLFFWRAYVLQTESEQASAFHRVVKDRQQKLDRIAELKKHGAAYLEIVRRDPNVLPTMRLPIEQIFQAAARTLIDQSFGYQESIEFQNASDAPGHVPPNATREQADMIRQLTGQLEYLDRKAEWLSRLANE